MTTTTRKTDWTTIQGVCEHYGQATYFDDGNGSFAVRHGPRRFPIYYWYKWDNPQGKYILTGTTKGSERAKVIFITYK